MLSGEEMAQFWRNYLARVEDSQNPLAAPILADLAGLPPVFMAVAECDILAEQNFAMADRLAAAGVAVRSVVYRGATHSFLEAVSIAPLAARAFDEASQWLRNLSSRSAAGGEPQTAPRSRRVGVGEIGVALSTDDE